MAWHAVTLGYDLPFPTSMPDPIIPVPPPLEPISWEEAPPVLKQVAAQFGFDLNHATVHREASDPPRYAVHQLPSVEQSIDPIALPPGPLYELFYTPRDQQGNQQFTCKFFDRLEAELGPTVPTTIKLTLSSEPTPSTAIEFFHEAGRKAGALRPERAYPIRTLYRSIIGDPTGQKNGLRLAEVEYHPNATAAAGVPPLEIKFSHYSKVMIGQIVETEEGTGDSMPIDANQLVARANAEGWEIPRRHLPYELVGRLHLVSMVGAPPMERQIRQEGITNTVDSTAQGGAPDLDKPPSKRHPGRPGKAN
jgi:hypothetical protein